MSHRAINLMGWAVALAATAVYVLTLEPTVSFWDCGEFIATSYGLQVGHPPGAPTYQIVAHCFTLLAGGDPARVAWWSNALSALCGGLTAMFLFWTLLRLVGSTWQAVVASLVGTACYVLCDTAWFSAVESEVYAMAMLLASIIVWAMLRWAQADEACGAHRWLLLIALLLGLSVGVHQLCLLTVPTLIVIYIAHRRGHAARAVRLCHIPLMVGLFLLGLSTYAIIPIRAAAHPPINMGAPSNNAAFKAYVQRDQYEKAPLLYGRCFNSPVVDYRDGKPVYAKEMNMLLPRMWKHGAHAEEYYDDWTGHHGKMVTVAGKEYYKPSQLDNMIVLGGYQLGYMYLRYLMWNFSGRYDDRQGFGNLQHGQFITGLPVVDRLLVGSGRKLPPSMHNEGHNRYFMLPLLLGIVGLVSLRRRSRRSYWTVLTLFLMGGVVLSLYLNHPMYEPRERDYAYILSFYAFAVWIGVGAHAVLTRRPKGGDAGRLRLTARVALLAAVPLLMGWQNWDDHDRSGRYVARDMASNLLASCPQGALLFTAGDNDTFPLWYLQEVEGERRDVSVINLSLLGSTDYAERFFADFDSQEWRQLGPQGRLVLLLGAHADKPLMFSHYARDAQQQRLGDRLQARGIGFLLDGAFDAQTIRTLRWHEVRNVYLDETSRRFLTQYWDDVLVAAQGLVDSGEHKAARILLDHAASQVPTEVLHDTPLRHRVMSLYGAAGDGLMSKHIQQALSGEIQEQLEYYGRMSASHQRMIPYTLAPLLEIAGSAGVEAEKSE